jgi:hypothetical protein
MSTEAFEDFYFKVCLLDYKALVPAMNALKKLMDKTDRVEITGPGTDLRFSIKGIPAIASGGNYNIPDGEVFTSPVRDSVEGSSPTTHRRSIREFPSTASAWSFPKAKSSRPRPARKPSSSTASSTATRARATSASSRWVSTR